MVKKSINKIGCSVVETNRADRPKKNCRPLRPEAHGAQERIKVADVSKASNYGRYKNSGVFQFK